MVAKPGSRALPYDLFQLRRNSAPSRQAEIVRGLAVRSTRGKTKSIPSNCGSSPTSWSGAPSRRSWLRPKIFQVGWSGPGAFIGNGTSIERRAAARAFRRSGASIARTARRPSRSALPTPASSAGRAGAGPLPASRERVAGNRPPSRLLSPNCGEFHPCSEASSPPRRRGFERQSAAAMDSAAANQARDEDPRGRRLGA